MERKLKVYEVSYASVMLRYDNRQTTNIYLTNIYSTKDLKNWYLFFKSSCITSLASPF